MHASTYFILSLLGVAHGLPTFLAEVKRALIQIKPVINLGLDLNNDNSCLGLGVSVCDPITVNSTTSSNAVNNSSKQKIKEDSRDTKSTSTNNTSNDSSGDNSLVDISPELGLDLNVNNDNSCLGLGISVCDPITVGSDVTKSSTNNDNESSSEKSNDSSSITDNNSSSNSNSDSDDGGSLLNLSPNVSPDVTLNNDNSCQGIGISACDPITVNSNTTQTSNN